MIGAQKVRRIGAATAPLVSPPSSFSPLTTMNSNRPPSSDPGERIQKVLANLGLGSRREIERWIVDGRVQVNNRVATLGERVTADDQILVDQRPVRKERRVRRRVIVYNKPEGELVTRNDPEGRATVFRHLPRLEQGRWIAIGRLDINSSGLVLFTTDGELANRLMHPAQQVEREYSVRVLGNVTPDLLGQLVQGVELEDGPARFEEIVESGGDGINRWFHVVLMEGRNREVRRLWDAVGLTVNRLKRVRFGPIFLGSLPVGRSRELDREEIEALQRATDPNHRPPRRKATTPRKPTPPTSPYRGPSQGRTRRR